MDEEQRTIGVYDDVESLGQSQGDFDMYLAQTIQPEESRGRVHVASRNVLASGTETVSRLVKSRSGHQGHLTYIDNQISTLLYDSNNVTIVRELKEMFEGQWEQFSLVHEKILIYIAYDTLAVTNTKATFNEQASARAELLDKINNYLSNEAMKNEQIQSSPTKAKSMNDFKTISHAILGSPKSVASARSVEKRQMQEKVELSIKQLHECQKIERDANAKLHKLEARQALEQQSLKERLEIAKLEEQYAIEAEQRLCFDDEQADLNNIKAWNTVALHCLTEICMIRKCSTEITARLVVKVELCQTMQCSNLPKRSLICVMHRQLRF